VKILYVNFSLSRNLQTENLDLKTASDVQNNIQDVRENFNLDSQQLFSFVETVCKKFEIANSLTRQCK
jgi:hypothetical protein